MTPDNVNGDAGAAGGDRQNARQNLNSSVDALSLWLAAAALRSADEPIQALVLDQVRQETEVGVPLAQALDKATRSERKPGDFGVEFIGPLLLPLLIEGVKAFWKLYLTELQKKAAGEIATVTIDAVKAVFRKAMSGGDKEKIVGGLETSLRAVAVEHKLSADQTARLIALVKSADFENELDPSG